MAEAAPGQSRVHMGVHSAARGCAQTTTLGAWVCPPFGKAVHMFAPPQTPQQRYDEDWPHQAFDYKWYGKGVSKYWGTPGFTDDDSSRTSGAGSGVDGSGTAPRHSRRRFMNCGKRRLSLHICLVGQRPGRTCDAAKTPTSKQRQSVRRQRLFQLI